MAFVPSIYSSNPCNIYLYIYNNTKSIILNTFISIIIDINTISFAQSPSSIFIGLYQTKP